jgi:hypothetical protein
MSKMHLISAAVAGDSYPIAGHHRALMEECFRTSLRDVCLHFSPSSSLANQELHSLAFSIGNHICFRSNPETLNGTIFTYLLAHELAHVIQQRRETVRSGKPEHSVRQLEREADVAAALVLQEAVVPDLSADVRALPRCWDVQGHYYTILWISFAAGLPLVDAKCNAFYAQMPDQVNELDAVPAGFSWFKKFGWGWYSRVNEIGLSIAQHSPSILGSPVRMSPDSIDYWRKQADPAIDKMVYDWKIQAGLHSLTGRNFLEESQIRLDRLDKLKPGTFEFGLALHPFGDSYAHRVGNNSNGKMYPPPLGHGCKGHGADMINLRRDFYIQYGLAMYDLFVRKWGTQRSNKSDRDVVEALLGAESLTKSHKQISGLMESARCALRDNCGISDKASTEEMSRIYRPEAPGAEKPWANFYVENHSSLDRDIPLTEGMFRQSLDCAEKWAIGAETFGVPPLSELVDGLHDGVFGIPEY